MEKTQKLFESSEMGSWRGVERGVTAVVPLITLKSSETQNVDLTDKVRANHYLRHFERRSALHGMNRTGSFRYMSDETSEGAQLQGYMLECVHRKETQRIRTTTNFLRRSGVPTSEDVFSSSVTNVTDSRVFHTHPSHSETSRLLTSSLSLGVPVPRPTHCV